MSKAFKPDILPELTTKYQGNYWSYGKLGPDRD